MRGSLRSLPKYDFSKRDNFAIGTFVLLVAAMVFGGASRHHELRLALVELTALPLLAMALMALPQSDKAPTHRFALLIVAAAAALPLVQLVPLPPGLWTALPGRDQEVVALQLAGISPGWLPLSLTPDRTWRAFLALTPPVAMFLGVLMMRPESRPRIGLALLAGVVAGIILGAAQLASGSDRLYPWASTDAGNVTGLFANRNHLATLCLAGIPFAMVFGSGALRRGGSSARMSFWLSTVFVASVIVAIGVIRSRTGVVLLGPALVLGLVAAWVAAGRGRPQPLLLGMAAVACIAIAAVMAFAAAPLIARFDVNAAPEGRFENWPIVAQAAEAHLPLGSGLGSFDAVYRSVEPLERLDATYFNQAHNDYLETWLEAGWPGAALVIAFLIWFGRRSWAAWSAGASTSRDLQRASSIAILMILLHSAVDYPLRTAAIATIFAFCCGLLELATSPDTDQVRTRSRRRL